MKRIEDAPKELQNLFKIELEKWPMPPDRDTEHAFKLAVEYFFVKGFNVAMATAGMPRRAKRIISHLIELDGQIYAISNDGRLFTNHYQRPNVWISYPDLPQD